MRNELFISSVGEQLAKSVHDGTNTLLINDILIDNSLWVGQGNYVTTINGHEIIIGKAPDLYGNYYLIKDIDYNYHFAKVQTENQRLIDLIYPIGSIYMSVNNIYPGTLFGGTWEQIQDTFLLAAGSNYANGSTGGEAEVTLTVDEIPSHKHTVNYVNYNRGSGSKETMGYLSSASQTNYADTSSIGNGQAHNNMPPYLVVNVWKRTA